MAAVSEGSVARLRAAAPALSKAARAERVEANGPLIPWVEAQHHALMAQADAAEHQEQLITHTLEGFHKVAKQDLAQCTELVQAARVTLATADQAKAVAEVRAQQATSEMIERVASPVVAGVRDAVVIRERRHNRNVEMKRVFTYGGLALGLVLAGNIWRGSYYSADDRRWPRASGWLSSIVRILRTGSTQSTRASCVSWPISCHLNLLRLLRRRRWRRSQGRHPIQRRVRWGILRLGGSYILVSR